MNNKKRNNEFGFTLVEIMVAAGLLGVLSVALVNMIGNMNRTSKRASQVFNIQQEIQRMSGILADQDSCEKTFSGESFGGTALGNSFNFNDINRSTGPNAGDFDTIYSVDDELGGADGVVHIEQMNATTTTGPGPVYLQGGINVTKVDALIRITFQKGRVGADIDNVKKASMGATDIARDFPVSFVLNSANGAVVSCYGADNQYTDAMCDALGGDIDANGRCVQVELQSRAAGTVGVALDYSASIGSNTAVALSGTNTTSVPLMIHRGGTNSMRFDENNIQTHGATLELNTLGNGILLGSAGNNMQVNSTVIGALNIAGTTNHTGATNFNNTATFNATADFNSTVTFDNANTLFRQGMTLSASRRFTVASGANIFMDGSSYIYFTDTSYMNFVSDRRLKHDDREIEDVLSKIDKIRGVEFVWNSSNRKDIGYIAQEIEDVFPEIVSTDKDGMKSVQYTKMPAVNTAGIKALRAENQELKFRVNLLMKALCEGEDAYKYEDVCALPIAPLE